MYPYDGVARLPARSASRRDAGASQAARDDVRGPRNAALRVAFPVPSGVAGAPPAYGVGGPPPGGPPGVAGAPPAYGVGGTPPGGPFVSDDTHPDKIRVTWGKSDHLLPIVQRNEGQISVADIDAYGVWIYTLLFRAGKVLISRQTSDPRVGAVGAMLTADCEFTAD